MTYQEVARHCMLMYPLVSHTRLGLGEHGTITNEYEVPSETCQLKVQDLTKDHPDFWAFCMSAMYNSEYMVCATLHTLARNKDVALGGRDRAGAMWCLTRNGLLLHLRDVEKLAVIDTDTLGST